MHSRKTYAWQLAVPRPRYCQLTSVSLQLECELARQQRMVHHQQLQLAMLLTAAVAALELRMAARVPVDVLAREKQDLLLEGNPIAAACLMEYGWGHCVFEAAGNRCSIKVLMRTAGAPDLQVPCMDA